MQTKLTDPNYYVKPVVGALVFMGYNSLAPSQIGGEGSGLVSNKNLNQGLTFAGASMIQEFFCYGKSDDDLWMMPLRSLRTGLLYATLSTGLQNDNRGFVMKTLVSSGADYVSNKLGDVVKQQMGAYQVVGEPADDDSYLLDNGNNNNVGASVR